MGNLTPMMQQYLDIKKLHQDAILFYRMGDFYEMFYEDAHIASRILGIALTTRDKGRENPVPMCGVPHHSASSYISRLIKQGLKVAICEQSEPADAAKGLVRREVVQVITPGLILEDDHLICEKPNYLMAVCRDSAGGRWGIAFIDISTGDFRVTEVGSEQDFLHELHRISPSEVVTTEPDIVPGGFFITNRDGAVAPERAREILCSHFRVLGVEGLGLKGHEAALRASAMALDYVRQTQKGVLAHITQLRFYSTGGYMILGANTRRNLELFDSLGGDKSNTLFGVMNRTMTPMGARMLGDWMSFPLMDLKEIEGRLDAVEELVRNPGTVQDIRDILEGIPDMERIVGRISTGGASPRDVRALSAGLARVPAMRDILKRSQSELLLSVLDQMDPLEEVAKRIDATLTEEPPSRLGDGGAIAPGVDAELDELKELRRNSRQWIAGLETRERERSGINSLKIGYNKVFGYYIEISKTHAHKVPEHYMRRQTLVNAERFITPELKEYEAKVLGAQDAIARIEARIFSELLDFLLGWTKELKTTIAAIACADTLSSLAWLALDRGYRRPSVSLGRSVQIRAGRHPVVEQVLKAGEFVPNDCAFDGEKDTIHMITGPNMAGKSTYMRQIALIAVMAQMGSFVPAAKAELGIVDRIFTRVGALDNLSAGQSTFLVEMSETAEILNNATENSLVILDEIGRGTSTYDGMSLAWAVAEYLDKRRVRTLFATHYHELADLARRHQGIKNLHMAVEESGHEVVFLRQVKRGAIGRSYGIYVARLAGVPDEVVDNARIILNTLGRKARSVPAVRQDAPVQESLFVSDRQEADADGYREIIRRIDELDLARTTPLEALNLLYDFKEKIHKPR
ncbi:MAG: DNA mismatch repair protein MutS [Pseudomonadota bacterium]|jgi:DNA mismatch repair protein MutS|nr:DNA mismatch repair protein MutS [Pseudomonadota bacterium]HON37771.1 DNA mismatch repair protein MutS [Deltaproteobacteria bacterium]HPX19057.1 DNA mismatch repair protein MutS [Deltaproteobacteria bacterium]